MLLSREPKPGKNWLPMTEQTGTLVVRQSYLDRDTEFARLVLSASQSFATSLLFNTLTPIAAAHPEFLEALVEDKERSLAGYTITISLIQAKDADVARTVLRKALEQFDLLVQGAPSEGLIYLRARMAEAVELRGRALEIDEDTETRPGSLEVMEASHSLFDEMEKSWTGQVPLDAANSPARG